MEKAKKLRGIKRRMFSRLHTELLTALQGKTESTKFRATFEHLQDVFVELKRLDNEVLDHLLLEDADEEILFNEETNTGEYVGKFNYAKVAVKEALSAEEDNVEKASVQSSGSNEQSARRKLNLPRLELKKFGGDIREWITFWAQFSKIDEDNDLDDSEKFQYLIQVTQEGSRARELIDSYPPTASNYREAIKALKARFGRSDVLIEVYIRDLLNLVIKNSSGTGGKISLTVLFDKIEAYLRALETLNVNAETCAAVLFPLVESCLPEDVLRTWHRAQIGLEKEFAGRAMTPTGQDLNGDLGLQISRDRLNRLMAFLKSEVEGEERIALAMTGFKREEKSNVSRKNEKTFKDMPSSAGLFSDVKRISKCIFCGESHESNSCGNTNNISLTDIKKTLYEKHYCFICVKPGHTHKKCHSKISCPNCKRRHHRIVCPEPDVKRTPSTKPVAEKALSALSSTTTYLQTLSVILTGPKKTKRARLLMDTGSQRSYVSKRVAQEMGLESLRVEEIVHALFGGVETAPVRHNIYKLRLSDVNETFRCNFEAMDQEVICLDVAPVRLQNSKDELDEAGIHIHDLEPGPIDILVGADIYGKLLTGKQKVLANGLVALETSLGWTLSGKAPGIERGRISSMVTFNLLNGDDKLKTLWDLETLGIMDPAKKLIEQERTAAVRQFFENTVTQVDGRYEVRLPWRSGQLDLPSNLKLALDRSEKKAQSLRAKLQLSAYNEVFTEWEKEGIIEKVNASKESYVEGTHYLPHRPIYKLESTTKIRPVFDASARTKGSPSLNDCLECGENLIELIPAILLRFRQHKIGVTADIKKAFLQISVHADDRDFLRFFEISEDGKRNIFRHRRVVFGLCCSPFLLGATIEHHLENIARRNSLKSWPSDILSRCFYVDNCVTSVKSMSELEKFREVATETMKEGLFELRSWEWTLEKDSDVTETTAKLLGLVWDRRNDTLRVSRSSLQYFDPTCLTKRKLLSLAQKIFDPIGFSCPIFLKPKILLQHAWSRKTGWDEELDEDLVIEFNKWFDSLDQIFEVEIPRWAFGKEGAHVEIHVFVDASTEAYAAVVYSRVSTGHDINVSLLAAKSRIAPVKEVTVPRLELLAANIGARLFSTVRDALTTNVEEIYFWTDSSTALAWICRNETWGVFVRNRVAEIRRLTPVNCWRHIPGSQNPADLASRGCSASYLKSSKWWEGPPWLRAPPSNWPLSRVEYCEDEILKEKKRVPVIAAIGIDGSTSQWYYHKFSKFLQIVRLVGWIKRFIENCRQQTSQKKGELSAAECISAETTVWRLVQAEAFGGTNDAKELVNLNTFIDSEGVIRLKTRLTNRDDEEEFRTPIILPKDHIVVKRLLNELHVRNKHVGVQGLLSISRERYWVIGSRRTIRSIVKKCVSCQRYAARSLKAAEPSLPKNRVRDARSFEITGMDLFGPLYIRQQCKIWVGLFTCAVTRAVHLEIVHSLSTESFLMALRRFIARRGRPATVMCDNGTNFRGAHNILQTLNWVEIERYGSAERIEWCFMPPTAAWWGGFWERLVRTIKQLLRRTLSRACLTLEEMATLLAECEVVVNSRPLTYSSEDPTDLTALTPLHFLQEIPKVGVADLDAADGKSFRRRINYRLRLKEELWKRFRVEYLGFLRNSKRESAGDLRIPQVGDIVLVGNDQTKRLVWPLARVTELFPGNDGRVRLVKLKTSSGEMLRPIQRIFPLELDGTFDPNPPDSAEDTSTKIVEVGTNDPEDEEDDENVSEEVVAEVFQPQSGEINARTRSGRRILLPKRLLD